jgi:hypothetical protein
MEDFLIIDNFLNDTEANALRNIIKTKSFKFGGQSNKGLLIDNKFFFAKMMDYFVVNNITKKIEKIVGKKLNVVRNYMHIQTFGQDGGFHIDDDRENTFTFCLYFTEFSNNGIDPGGEMLFKLENKIIAIETLFNRGIFFPSQYLHIGLAYNSKIKDGRICLAWKLIEII